MDEIRPPEPGTAVPASHRTVSFHPGLAHLRAAVRLGQLDTGLVQAGHVPVPVLVLVVGCPGRRSRGKQGCIPGKAKAAFLPLCKPLGPAAWALLPSPGQSLGKQSPGQVPVPAVLCSSLLSPEAAGLTKGAHTIPRPGFPVANPKHHTLKRPMDHHPAAEVWGGGAPSFLG